ncbi:extracellular solute-binding protein [Kaistia dalseonensis]|uniref:Multiple sugar transport system substrate-binding protein/putative spermidine/putrescine transport system substrate-binding protein n=1 Tax=Kaistia dalseonensis TaxID=410840 RepID=A0ABU0H9L0_9HYPH|nr:extracellular solute-binding protein [Kaistia dalseonensis]MCX5496387.1 extracellular solute-binding protein [Kaistia dalseonensis]MDQ0439008.1 multiple sugar transport system substrate-binding protein/putative spermidine/putrescine transport system substrate-binding protein [Kaistia dalseonensis]
MAALISTAAILPASAQTKPVGSDTFNTKHLDFDATTLTRENFYEVLAPIAKQEGEVNLYSFAASFPVFWKEAVIPGFEKKYGVRVNFYDVKEDVAKQQLIAVHQAGEDSPADAYFAPGPTAAETRNTPIIANLPLADLLPEAKNYDPKLLRVSFGYEHGGTFMPLHRDQTGMGYNSALVKAEDVPADFPALLAYAKANPGKVAITSPLKGGSGENFLYGVAQSLLTGECHDKLTNDFGWDDAAAADWVKNSGCFAPVWDYFRELTPLVEVTNGNADTQNLIGNNAATIGTVWEDYAYTFVQDKQLPESYRITLLANGQDGGGDGAFLVRNATHPAAALLLIDYAMSYEPQLWKMKHMASRTARLDIALTDAIDAHNAQFLVPEATYRKYAIGYPSVPVMTAMRDAYVAEILSKL